MDRGGAGLIPNIGGEYLDCLSSPKNTGLLANDEALSKLVNLPDHRAHRLLTAFMEDGVRPSYSPMYPRNTPPLERDKGEWVLGLPSLTLMMDGANIVDLVDFVDYSTLQGITPEAGAGLSDTHQSSGSTVLNQLYDRAEGQYRFNNLSSECSGRAPETKLVGIALTMRSLGGRGLETSYTNALSNPVAFDRLSDQEQVLELVDPGRDGSIGRADRNCYELYFSAIGKGHEQVAEWALDNKKTLNGYSGEFYHKYRQALDRPEAAARLGDVSIWTTIKDKGLSENVACAYVDYLASGADDKAAFILSRNEPFLHEGDAMRGYLDCLTTDQVHSLSTGVIKRSSLGRIVLNNLMADIGVKPPLNRSEARRWDDRIATRGRKFIMGNPLIQEQIQASRAGRWGEYVDNLQGNISSMTELSDLGVDVAVLEEGLGRRSYRKEGGKTKPVATQFEMVQAMADGVVSRVFNEGDDEILNNPRKMFNLLLRAFKRPPLGEIRREDFPDIVERFTEEMFDSPDNLNTAMLVVGDILQNESNVSDHAQAQLARIHAEEVIMGLGGTPKWEGKIEAIEAEVSDKDPRTDLTIGNDVGDCKRLGHGDETALPYYFRDKASPQVPLYVGKKRVGVAWIHLVKIDGKPVMDIDCIDVTAELRADPAIYDAGIKYVTEWAKKAKFKGVVMGAALYNNANHYAELQGYETATVDMEKIDHFDASEYPTTFADTLKKTTGLDGTVKMKGTQKVWVISPLEE